MEELVSIYRDSKDDAELAALTYDRDDQAILKDIVIYFTAMARVCLSSESVWVKLLMNFSANVLSIQPYLLLADRIQIATLLITVLKSEPKLAGLLRESQELDVLVSQYFPDDISLEAICEEGQEMVSLPGRRRTNTWLGFQSHPLFGEPDPRHSILLAMHISLYRLTEGVGRDKEVQAQAALERFEIALRANEEESLRSAARNFSQSIRRPARAAPLWPHLLTPRSATAFDKALSPEAKALLAEFIGAEAYPPIPAPSAPEAESPWFLIASEPSLAPPMESDAPPTEGTLCPYTQHYLRLHSELNRVAATSGSSLSRLREGFTSLLDKDDTLYDAQPLSKLSHEALLRLASLSPINPVDPISQEAISVEDKIVISTGNQFGLRDLLRYHFTRPARRDEREEKRLINPFTNNAMHKLDEAHVWEVARRKPYFHELLRLGIASEADIASFVL